MVEFEGSPAVATLALTQGVPASWLDAISATVRRTSDQSTFRHLLKTIGPAVVVVWVPPATTEDINVVAAARRARRDLRALLIDHPSNSSERLIALRSGFDEALDTHVEPAELASRVELLADQVRVLGVAARIQLGPSLWLDGERRELIVAGSPVHLRPREYLLLAVLAREPGRTFSRQELLDAVGAEMRNGDLRSVDVHVTWLREKLESAGQGAPTVSTVRGVGYRLEAPRLRVVNEALTERQQAVDGGTGT
jgi:DNA-binding response OmpR family regulator